MTGAVALAALAALAFWPDADGESGPPPELDVATWVPRGSLADDQTLLRSAVASWRTGARDDVLDEPGRDVDLLYLGDPDGQVVALLRSWNAATGLLVAAGRDDGTGRIEVLATEVVEDDPPWLTLPSTDRLRVLAAPGVARDSSLVLRRTESVWNRAAIRDDGVSMPLSSLDTVRPIVAVARVESDRRALEDVAAVSPTSVLPVATEVDLAAPRWGRAVPLSPEEVDAALYVASAVPESADGVAVLASTRVPGGRLVLVEVGLADDGEHRVLLVEPGADGAAAVGAAPAVTDSLALAAVTGAGGRTRVLAAAAPSVDGLQVRTSDGETLVSGVGATAVVVPPPVPAAIIAVGTHDDGSITSQVRLRLAPAGPSLGQ